MSSICYSSGLDNIRGGCAQQHAYLASRGELTKLCGCQYRNIAIPSPRWGGAYGAAFNEGGMFGIYRTVLALFVVFQHFHGWAPLGSFAVFAFFCLSGFLMTLLVCGPYQGRPFAFAANRFLRLYPAYWAVCGLTAALIWFAPIPEKIGSGQWNWALPTKLDDIIANFTLMAPEAAIRLVPTSWAVTNEVFFYVLIGLGLTRTKFRTALFLLASTIAVWLTLEPAQVLFYAVCGGVPLRGRRGCISCDTYPSRFGCDQIGIYASNRDIDDGSVELRQRC